MFSARGKFPSEEHHGEALTLLLAEDRTEVDDEEYFQTLGEKEDDDDEGCSTKKKNPKAAGGGITPFPTYSFLWLIQFKYNTELWNSQRHLGIWEERNVYKKDDHIHVCETVSRWQHIVCAGPKEGGKV